MTDEMKEKANELRRRIIGGKALASVDLMRLAASDGAPAEERGLMILNFVDKTTVNKEFASFTVMKKVVAGMDNGVPLTIAGEPAGTVKKSNGALS